MRQSTLFTKTRKEAPKDEVSKNAQLLIRAGYIHKEMAGVYSLMPLGLRVIKKIEQIIREEMDAIGGQEMQLTALQEKSVWEKSGRWSDDVVDNWFKTKLKNDTEVGLGFTQEEPLTNIMTEYIDSYRDLPRYPYQIQTKFRNETRAKSGIMRGREFLMKDLYSFSRDIETHSQFYEKTKTAYTNVYNRAGLGDKTHITMASGGSFSKYSHEFQTETEAGEDIIHICTQCNVAINKEIFSEYKECPDCNNVEFREAKAVEVGNIFTLGTRFSEPFELMYSDEKGEKKPVIMGSYGIGLGRLMGTIVEVLGDDKGIVWPKEVAPFKVHLVYLLGKEVKAKEYAEELYTKLTQKGIDVLFDDRDARAGEKFADSDLIGIPYRVVVSDKTLVSKQIECKERATGTVTMIEESALFDL
jgi:prolyl-tRNA synthetase